MKIVWKKELETGLEWQDEQHKKIFEQLNNLEEAMQQNAGASVIKELVGFLSDYTSGHLLEEEEYMIDHRCPAYPSHKKAHTLFLEEFNELKAIFYRQGPSTMIVMRMHSLVRDWFLQHIMDVDQHMRDGCVE